jgi:hypothetical protein
MNSKKAFILVLDTDLASDYLFGKFDKFSDIAISIWSAQIGFDALLYITPFTFFELLKGRIHNRKDTHDCLLTLMKTTDGVLHIRGFFDDSAEKFCLTFWLNDNGDFRYDDFVIFFENIASKIASYLSTDLMYYFILTSYITSLVSTASGDFEDGSILSSYFKLMNEETFHNLVLSLIEGFVTKDALINGGFDSFGIFETINNLIIKLFASIVGKENLLINYKCYERKIRDNIRKICMLARNVAISKKVAFKLGSNDSFIASVIDGLNREKVTFFTDMVKHLVVHSPLNKGTFDINDFIDIRNLSCADDNNIELGYKVIYSTREKKWRGFIEKNTDRYPFLYYCMIIGDEGEFDLKKSKTNKAG